MVKTEATWHNGTDFSIYWDFLLHRRAKWRKRKAKRKRQAMTKLEKRPNELIGLLKMGLIDPSAACRFLLDQHNGPFPVTAQKKLETLSAHKSYQRLLSSSLVRKFTPARSWQLGKKADPKLDYHNKCWRPSFYSSSILLLMLPMSNQLFTFLLGL